MRVVVVTVVAAATVYRKMLQSLTNHEGSLQRDSLSLNQLRIQQECPNDT